MTVYGRSGFVCSTNGRYLISLGGRECHTRQSLGGGNATDKIIVFDLWDHESKPMLIPIRCPVATSFSALSMRDKHHGEVLTSGFVRSSFNGAEMKGMQLPPLYLIQMMAMWVEMEWVVLWGQHMHSNNLWKMRMDEILKWTKAENDSNVESQRICPFQCPVGHHCF